MILAKNRTVNDVVEKIIKLIEDVLSLFSNKRCKAMIFKEHAISVKSFLLVHIKTEVPRLIKSSLMISFL